MAADQKKARRQVAHIALMDESGLLIDGQGNIRIDAETQAPPDTVGKEYIPVHNLLMWQSGSVHGAVIAVLMGYSQINICSHRIHRRRTLMKTWLKPQITESEAGMEVTSYLPAELDRA